eukprot:403330870
MKTQNTFNSAQTFQQQINESQTHIENDFSPQSQKILPQESSLSPGKEVHNRINSSIIDQNQHLVLHQFNFQNQNEASLDHPFMQSKKIIISQRDQTFGNSPSSVSRQIHQHQNSYESMNEQKQVLGNQQENSLKASPLKDGKIDMLLLQIQQKLNETSPSRTPKIILSDEKGQESNLQDDNQSPVRTKNKTINQRDHQKLKEFYQNTVQFKEQLSQLKDRIKELNSHADDYGHKFQEFQSGLVDYSSKNQYIQEQLQSLKEFNPSRGVMQRNENL